MKKNDIPKLCIAIFMISALCIRSVHAEGTSNAKDVEKIIITELSKVDFKASISDLKMKASQGDSTSELALGIMFMGGEKVQKDYEESAKWFHLAATHGSKSAPLYEKIVNKVVEEQKVTLESAKHGDAAAQFQMGVNSGNKIDAIIWYRLSAGQNYVGAQTMLGLIYQESGNYLEAEKWLRLADAKHDQEAQFILGKLFVSGKISPNNSTEAKTWGCYYNHGLQASKNAALKAAQAAAALGKGEQSSERLEATQADESSTLTCEHP